jgi:hypothetical protein
MAASSADIPPFARRGDRLRDAILSRYGTEDDFVAESNRHVAFDPDRIVSGDLLYSLAHDPTRWPALLRLETLAREAGWTLEEVVAELGADLSSMPRLRTRLRSNLTRIEPGPLPAVADELRVPITLTSEAMPYATGSLQSMIVGGPLQPALAVGRASPPGRLSARVGDFENAAYPKIPARAWLRVDRTDTALARTRYSLIEHPNGLSCCCAEQQGDRVFLLPEQGSRYPRQEFWARDVTVHGHVVAMAGMVGRWSPPHHWTGDRLRMNTRFLSDGRYGPSPDPAKQLLRAAWHRRGQTYGEHDKQAHRRQQLLGKHGKQPRSTLRPYVEGSDRPAPRPDFETLFGFATAFDLDYQELLVAFGLSPSIFRRRVPDAADVPSQAIGQLRAQEFGAYLEGLGWDLPWLCALFSLVDKSRVYHLGQLHPGWSPLLRRGCFVVVDPARQAVPRARGREEAALPRRDWERPMYLLETPSRPHLLCGYCERDGSKIRVLPHPEDPGQAVREFTLDVDVQLIGRVTHVATLLP